MSFCASVYIAICILWVSPVIFTSLKWVLSLCVNHVMPTTSMGLGSCPIDSLSCLECRSSLMFSCCLWGVCVCIWLALVSNVDQWGHLASIVGLPDKSSSLSGVFIPSQIVHSVVFIKWRSGRAVLHRFGVSRTCASHLRGSIAGTFCSDMCFSHCGVPAMSSDLL